MSQPPSAHGVHCPARNESTGAAGGPCNCEMSVEMNVSNVSAVAECMVPDCKAPLLLEGWPLPYCLNCATRINSHLLATDFNAAVAFASEFAKAMRLTREANERERREQQAQARRDADKKRHELNHQQEKARKAAEAIQRVRKRSKKAADPENSIILSELHAAALHDSPARSGARTAEMLNTARARVKFGSESQAHQELLSRLGLLNGQELSAATNNIEFPDPVSETCIAEVSAAAAEALKSLAVVCVVCDCLTDMDELEGTAVNCDFGFFALANVKSKLAAATVVPPLAPEILAQYDLAQLHENLTGLLLSTHSLAQVPASHPPLVTSHLYVCIECHSSLMGDSPHPPADAIANHNAIGQLPPGLRDSSWAENALVSLAYAKAWIVVLKGGGQKALRGHTLTVEMDPGAVAQKLPRSPADCTLKVVIAGALTPVQKMATMRTHQVRHARIRDLLAFFQTHNPLYRHVQVNAEELAKIRAEDSLIDMQGLVVDESIIPQPEAPEPMGNESLASAVSGAADTALAASISGASIKSKQGAKQSVARNLRLFARADADEHDEAAGNELNYTFRHVSRVETLSTGLADDALLDIRPRHGGAGLTHCGPARGSSASTSSAGPGAQTAECHAIGDSFATVAQAIEERFVSPNSGSSNCSSNNFNSILAVRAGERFVPEHQADILTLMFPHCFPYGRGDMSEPRRKPMGRAHLLKRLLRLAGGANTFGSTSFVLKAYNMIARAEASKKAYIRVRLGDLNFEGLNLSDLRALVAHKMDCSAALRSHLQVPDPPANLSEAAKLLFRTTEVCAGVMPHTDQYAKCFGRVRVFSMWNQFGTPTLMITLNPNDLASLNLLHYAGHEVQNQQQVPDPAVRRGALADSPVAAARAFWWNVHVFIRYCVGWDLKRHKPAKVGGFFGLPLALFAAVEEQNRGSLHLHLLVWISGALPLALRGKELFPVQLHALQQKMSAYVDSIMTAELQCPTEFHACPHAANCNHQDAATSPTASNDQEEDHAMPASLGNSAVGARASIASHCESVKYRMEHTIDIHFGQIKSTQQYQRPLRAAANGIKLEPPIVVCKRAPASVQPVPFGVQTLARKSVTAARLALGMPEVDFESKENFHRWSYSTGSIPYVAPPERAPIESDAVDSPVRVKHLEYLRFIVNIATVQLGCMAHDPAHTPTCVKNGSTECRFHFPFAPHAYEPGNGPVAIVYEELDCASDEQSPAQLSQTNDDMCDNESKCEQSDEPAVAAASTRTAAAAAAASTVARFQWNDEHIENNNCGKRVPIGLDVTLRRGGISAYQNQCNLGLTALFRCNNDIKFVQDPGTGYYVTLYHVKTHAEESSHFDEILAKLERGRNYEIRKDPSMIEANAPLVNEQTTSLRLALRVIRAATGGATVGAMFAAFFSLGFSRFICSEDFSGLPLASAEEFIRTGCKQLSASLTGVRIHNTRRSHNNAASESATADPESNEIDNDRDAESAGAYAVTQLHDYLFRSVKLEGLSWYELVSFYERAPHAKAVPLGRKRKTVKRKLYVEADESDVDLDSELESDWYPFMAGHPLSATHGLKRREVRVTPILYGARLSDARKLTVADADPEEQQTYGLRALLLFSPFREADLKSKAGAELVHNQNSTSHSRSRSAAAAAASSSSSVAAAGSAAADSHSLTMQDSAWSIWRQRSAALPSQDDFLQARLNLVRIINQMQCYWTAMERKRENRADDLTRGGVDNGSASDDEDNPNLESDEYQVDFATKVDEAAALADNHATAQSATITQLMKSGALDSLPNAQHGAEATAFATSMSRADFVKAKKKLAVKAAEAEAGDVNLSVTVTSTTAAAAPLLQLSDSALPIANQIQEPAQSRADWIQGAIMSGQENLPPISPEIEASVASVKGFKDSRQLQDVNAQRAAAQHAVQLLLHVIQHADYTLNVQQSQIFLLFGKQLLVSCFGVKFDLLQDQMNQMIPESAAAATSYSAALASSVMPVVAEDLHASRAAQAASAARAARLSAHEQPDDQLIAYLGGAAGTGKSRVIGAIRYLYRLLGKGASVLVTATTGAAAVCLGASTVHSAVGLMVPKGKQPSALRVAKFSQVRLLVIDEVSMLGEKNLKDLNLKLQELKLKDKPFGGFSILFTGDFCQFPPVNATSLMAPKQSALTLWRTVKTVVVLTEVKRAEEDPEFIKYLDTFRHGRVTAEAIAYFNQRVLKPVAETSDSHAHAAAAASMAVAAAAGPSGSTPIPIMVAENRDRVMMNKAIFTHLHKLYKPAIVCRDNAKDHDDAVIADSPFFRINAVYLQGGEAGSSGQTVVDSKLQKAFSMAKVDGIDHHLRVFIGMEIVVTQNICVELGIANGSRARVVRLQLFQRMDAHGNNRPASANYDEEGIRTFDSNEVAFIHLHLMKPSGVGCTSLLEDDLPPGVFRLQATREPMADLKKSGGLLEGHNLTYSMVQFPMISAHCITGHKMQGLTVPRLIISHESLSKELPISQIGSKRIRKFVAPPQYVYVGMSRLPRLDGLTLVQALPLDPAHPVYRLAKELEIEMKRLHELERQTINANTKFFALFGEAAKSVTTVSAGTTLTADAPSQTERQSELLRNYMRLGALHPKLGRPSRKGFSRMISPVGGPAMRTTGSISPSTSAQAASGPAALNAAPLLAIVTAAGAAAAHAVNEPRSVKVEAEWSAFNDAYPSDDSGPRPMLLDKQ